MLNFWFCLLSLLINIFIAYFIIFCVPVSNEIFLVKRNFISKISFNKEVKQRHEKYLQCDISFYNFASYYTMFVNYS